MLLHGQLSLRRQQSLQLRPLTIHQPAAVETPMMSTSGAGRTGKRTCEIAFSMPNSRLLAALSSMLTIVVLRRTGIRRSASGSRRSFIRSGRSRRQMPRRCEADACAQVCRSSSSSPHGDCRTTRQHSLNAVGDGNDLNAYGRWRRSRGRQRQATCRAARSRSSGPEPRQISQSSCSTSIHRSGRHEGAHVLLTHMPPMHFLLAPLQSNTPQYRTLVNTSASP